MAWANITVHFVGVFPELFRLSRGIIFEFLIGKSRVWEQVGPNHQKQEEEMF